MCVCFSLKQVDICKKVLKMYRYIVADMTLDETTWLAFDKYLQFIALLWITDFSFSHYFCVDVFSAL